MLHIKVLCIGLLGLLMAGRVAAAPATRAEVREADVAFRIIRQHHLVPKELRRCYFIMKSENSAGPIVVFDVRERHKPPRCAGDPDTAPRMFSLEIDMRTGRARWDRLTVEHLDGGMRPVESQGEPR